VGENGANLRFVVTSLSAGDVENRIKEWQIDLFADRTRTPPPQAGRVAHPVGSHSSPDQAGELENITGRLLWRRLVG